MAYRARPALSRSTFRSSRRRRDIVAAEFRQPGPVFVLSKLAAYAIDPATIGLAFLALGAALLWTGRRALGRGIVTATVGLALGLAIVPVGPALLARLEERFPMAPLPDRADGVIVLSGFTNVGASVTHGTVELNDAADRVAALLTLARRYPQARLVVTGGSSSAFGDAPAEAVFARRLVAELGGPLERIVFEDQARNTAENARLSKALVQPAPAETWLLVTSAAHMPRAVGGFRAVGWNVVPYPVDYRTRGSSALGLGFAPLENLEAMTIASHEIVGLLVYWVRGLSDDPWPGPLP